MGAFDKLGGEIDHLINSLISQPIAGSNNFGVTQYTFWMLIAIIVLFAVIFGAIKRQQLVPQGRFVNGFEMVFEFVRNEVVDGVIGPEGRKHLPFIMSVFFFILINNLIGLIPGAKPGTGTIGVTLALALCSFIYFLYFGVKKHGAFGYLKTFSPKGVVFPINIVVWVIELFSTAIRLVTLAVRLFANLFAGHVVLGVFAILTSLFVGQAIEQMTLAATAGALSSILWIALLIVLYLVEVVVASIQAYVFTVLSAVYIQIAISDEH